MKHQSQRRNKNFTIFYCQKRKFSSGPGVPGVVVSLPSTRGKLGVMFPKRLVVHEGKHAKTATSIRYHFQRGRV